MFPYKSLRMKNNEIKYIQMLYLADYIFTSQKLLHG